MLSTWCPNQELLLWLRVCLSSQNPSHRVLYTQCLPKFQPHSRYSINISVSTAQESLHPSSKNISQDTFFTWAKIGTCYKCRFILWMLSEITELWGSHLLVPNHCESYETTYFGVYLTNLYIVAVWHNIGDFLQFLPLQQNSWDRLPELLGFQVTSRNMLP